MPIFAFLIKYGYIYCSFFNFRADAGVGEPGRTVNPLAEAFGGSNPSPPTAQVYILISKGNI